MNIIDIIIIGFIVLGALLGFANGGIKTLTSAGGLIIVTILSFILKDVIAEVLFKFCPFFDFFGIIKGVTAINILVYEVIAFIVIFGILYGVLKVIISISGLLEGVLKATIILSIPSKIIGAIIGALENFFLVFIVLYFVSLPFFNFKILNESELKNKILYNTPLLSIFVEKNVTINDELTELMDKYKKEENRDHFNYDVLELMLKYKIVSVETVEDLVERGKLKIDYVYTLLDQYR